MSPLSDRQRLLRGGIAIVVLVLAACGADEPSSSPIETAAQPPGTSAPSEPTMVVPQSTQPTPATTAAESSTDSTVSAAPFALAADGLGSVSFGASAESTLAAAEATLGAPTLDQIDHWVNGGVVMPPGDGPYWTRSSSWNQPVSRVVCWEGDRSVCVYLTGQTDDVLTFVGWLSNDPRVAMSDGLTVGARLSDFPDIVPTLVPQSCTSAWGWHDDVRLDVLATDVPFIEVDEDSNETPQSPDPATLEVQSLTAGYIGDNDGEVCTY